MTAKKDKPIGLNQAKKILKDLNSIHKHLLKKIRKKEREGVETKLF